MRLEFGLDLVVVDAQAGLLRGPGRHREHNHQQGQETRQHAERAPQVSGHSAESPGNDNPFPMMKILTQKMLVAQGWGGALSEFCLFKRSEKPAFEGRSSFPPAARGRPSAHLRAGMTTGRWRRLRAGLGAPFGR